MNAAMNEISIARIAAEDAARVVLDLTAEVDALHAAHLAEIAAVVEVGADDSDWLADLLATPLDLDDGFESISTRLSNARRALEVARYAKTQADAAYVVASTMKCPRCAGNGNLHCFQHVSGGVCFRCMGRGRVAR